MFCWLVFVASTLSKYFSRYPFPLESQTEHPLMLSLHVDIPWTRINSSAVKRDSKSWPAKFAIKRVAKSLPDKLHFGVFAQRSNKLAQKYSFLEYGRVFTEQLQDYYKNIHKKQGFRE